MKKIFTIAIATIFCTGVYAQTHTIEKKFFVKTEGTIDIKAYYPHFTEGKYADKLNELVFNLFSRRAENPENKSAQQSIGIDDFIWSEALYMKHLGESKSIDAIPYNYYSNWHYFENKYVISLCMDFYLSNGVDNLGTAIGMINLNAETGEIFDPKVLIVDSLNLLEDVAKYFCRDRKLPKDALMLNTGLKYELADLPLPKSVGFSDIGMVFFYNRGEIATKGYPAIKVEVPYREITDNTASDFLNDFVSSTDGEAVTMKRVKAMLKEMAKIKKPKQRR